MSVRTSHANIKAVPTGRVETIDISSLSVELHRWDRHRGMLHDGDVRIHCRNSNMKAVPSVNKDIKGYTG
jgi:hypothetical protein